MTGLNINSDLIKFTDWEQVADWATQNQHTFPNLFVNQIHKLAQGRYPADAFTLGQLASKIWLTSVIYDQIGEIGIAKDIAYLGCWLAPLATFLSAAFNASRILGFDSDPDAIAMADDFNSDYVKDNWRFKGVVSDINIMNWGSPEFVIDGELITDFVPDVIVNTSSEHMSDDWFLTTSKDTLVIMQSNNSSRYQGHINCVDSIEHMQSQYPMRDIVYAGEMISPAYTRYMQIGYPA